VRRRDELRISDEGRCHETQPPKLSFVGEMALAVFVFFCCGFGCIVTDRLRLARESRGVSLPGSSPIPSQLIAVASCLLTMFK